MTTYNPVLIGGAQFSAMSLDPENPDKTKRVRPLDQMYNLSTAFAAGWSTYDLLKAFETFSFVGVPSRPPPPAEPWPHLGFRAMGLFGEYSPDLGAPTHEYLFWDPWATDPPDVEPIGDGVVAVPLGFTQNESIANFCQKMTEHSGYDVFPSRFWTTDAHGNAIFFSRNVGETATDFFNRANAANGVIDQASLLAKVGGPEFNYPTWAPDSRNVFSKSPSGGGYVFQSQTQPNGGSVLAYVYQDFDRHIKLRSADPDGGLILDPDTLELVGPLSDPYNLEYIGVYYVWVTPYSCAIFSKHDEPITNGVGHSNWFCTCLYAPPEFVNAGTGHSYFSVGDFRTSMIVGSGNAVAVRAGSTWNKWWANLPAGTIKAAYVEPNVGTDDLQGLGPSGNGLEAAPLVALNAQRSGDTTALIYGYVTGAIVTLAATAQLDDYTIFDGIRYICAITDGTRTLWLQAPVS